MSEDKSFNYAELILNEIRELKAEVRDMRSELRETRRELNQRMDKLELRQDRLDAKLEETRRELKTAIDASQKEIHSSTRHSQTLTATIVSIVVVVIYSVLTH